MPTHNTLRSIGLAIGKAAYLAAQPVFLVTSRRPRTRVFVFSKDAHSVLLIRNYISDGKWDLPGGGVKRGESLAAAAGRELHEETMIRVKDGALKDYGDVIERVRRRAPLVVRLYGCQVPRRTNIERGVSFEVADIRWFPLNQLPTCTKTVHEALKRVKL